METIQVLDKRWRQKKSDFVGGLLCLIQLDVCITHEVEERSGNFRTEQHPTSFKEPTTSQQFEVRAIFNHQQTIPTHYRRFEWKRKVPVIFLIVNLATVNPEDKRQSVALNRWQCFQLWGQVIFASVQHWSLNAMCFYDRGLKALHSW